MIIGPKNNLDIDEKVYNVLFLYLLGV